MIHNFINETTYDMQTHRCHQCSLESHHSGQWSEHIENCCTESLHLSMRLCICNSWWRVAESQRVLQYQPILCELQTYGSSSHHFHQSMSWSQYIVKRRRCTDRWYTETGWSYNLSCVQNEWIGNICSYKTLRILSETPRTDDIPQYKAMSTWPEGKMHHLSWNLV